MVDGIIGRLHDELGDFTTLATGGLAGAVVPHCRTIDEADDAADADRAADHLGAQPELVKAGDVEGLRAALAADPSLASARPDGRRTLLHVLTDWPGGLPRRLETLAVLVEAGADVNARFGGEQARRR